MGGHQNRGVKRERPSQSETIAPQFGAPDYHRIITIMQSAIGQVQEFYRSMNSLPCFRAACPIFLATQPNANANGNKTMRRRQSIVVILRLKIYK
jgi:hypothetical protein